MFLRNEAIFELHTVSIKHHLGGTIYCKINIIAKSRGKIKWIESEPFNKTKTTTTTNIC